MASILAKVFGADEDMREIYLIRHGKVRSVDGKKRCIGRTDTPLDEEGRGQARALAEYFAEHPVQKVYASPLSRARETAQILADGRYPVEIREDLAELDMGEWEDVPLQDLHKELTSEPVKGEGRQAGKARFARCIEEILAKTGEGESPDDDERADESESPDHDVRADEDESPDHDVRTDEGESPDHDVRADEGESPDDDERADGSGIDAVDESGTGRAVAVVAHAGVLCAYLSGLLGTPLETSRALPQPYGGFSRIRVDGEERKVLELGRMPRIAPDEAQCVRLWDRYGTPEPVRAHCRAVCEEALSLGEELRRAGVRVDIPLLTAGALLHDLMRHKKDHPKEGARCLLKEGYPMPAQIILRHHDWERRLDWDMLFDLVESGRPGSAAEAAGDKAGSTAMGAGDGSGDQVTTDGGPAGTAGAMDNRSAPVRRRGDRSMAAVLTEEEDPAVVEGALLYLADKRIRGTERVTLEQRFSDSQHRCLDCEDPESAMQAHKRRYEEARKISEMVRGWMEG